MREMSFFKKIKLIIFLPENDISRISQNHACVQQTYFSFVGKAYFRRTSGRSRRCENRHLAGGATLRRPRPRAVVFHPPPWDRLAPSRGPRRRTQTPNWVKQIRFCKNPFAAKRSHVATAPCACTRVYVLATSRNFRSAQIDRFLPFALVVGKRHAALD